MKALLVCAAPAAGFESHLIGLAAEADVVIAVDGGGEVCLRADVVPGVLVGDLDSIDPSRADELKTLGVLVHTYPAHKDETDLEIAIREARGLGATQIVVTAVTTGRLDHTLGALAALASAADLAPTVSEPDLTAWILSEHGRRRVRLEGIGSLVSLIAYGGIASVSADGVRWPLEHADMSPATALGISNVVADAEGATVTVHAGCVLVLSPRDVHPSAVAVP